MQEVVRVEVLKLLQAGIIYPISDSPWVSPTQVVPKKSGITVLERVSGHPFYCFLDGYSVAIPTNVKGVRQFLGHVGFYRRFIKDFSKLARPLCELLVKDAKFIWDDRCQRSFEELKLFLTTAPIVRAPNWKLPFEVMCDASDFAIGAVLGQREDGKPYVIYYASKTLNEAQRNYTTTERIYLLTKQDAKARQLDGFSCFKSSISISKTRNEWRMW
ncbi:Retrovirus-related Pol polyprotein from transposon 17.6 [Vitis vinifera]|uniref:Retrovirus-related Pol polyprotein from transposon 17.6 n=1 Tax=Vitis vinifera TaxID=29760 RepID=A0A438C5W7_VITVI|nr:Retrovirus-related Pol polyprotein from transposon 17.6 [Vitis vinifera]